MAQFVDLNLVLRVIDEEKSRFSRTALENPPSDPSLFDYGKAVGFMAGLSQIRSAIVERVSQEEADHELHQHVPRQLYPDESDADSDPDGDEFTGYVP